MFFDSELLKEVGIGIGSLLSGLGAVRLKTKYLSGSNGKATKELKIVKSESCPDPSCHNEVINTSNNVKELNRKFEKFEEDIYPKINDTAVVVGEIKGFLKGKGW
jgi:hypothetical protein